MTENNDCSGMCFLGPLFSIVIAKSALERPAKNDGKPHRELLEAELAALASGFTLFNAAGVWHGASEASLCYLVSLPQEGAELLLEFLSSFRTTIGEDAIFVGVSGLGLLLHVTGNEAPTEGQFDATAA